MKENKESIYRLESKFFNTNFYKDNCNFVFKKLDDSERFDLINAQSINDGFEYSSECETEDSFVKNFANKLCSVSRHNKLVVIEKNEDKLSLKVFMSSKSRDVGKTWFRKRTSLYFITYNIKTNDLYDGFLSNYHQKRGSTKTIRRNQFWRQPFSRFIDNLRGALHKTIDSNNILSEIDKIINLFLDHIPNVKRSPFWSIDEIMFKLRCDVLGVKLPDNWQMFSRLFPTPTKKELKKHDFKYIEAFQGALGLTGDKFKKIFHSAESINTQILEFMIKIFGSEFVKRQDTDKIVKLIKDVTHYNNYTYLGQLVKDTNLTERETKNFWNLFMLSTDNKIEFNTLCDHLNFIIDLRKLGEDVKLKAKNQITFNAEHEELSLLSQSYKQGVFYRFYNQDFASRVQQPIFDKDYFYPVLLTSTTDYNEESKTQSNCVRGYVDNPSSLIISLRKGDVNSKDRATIEYRYSNKSNKLYVMNNQSLGRFNEKLSSDWGNLIRKLDDRLNILVGSNVFTLPEMVIKFKHKDIYQKAIINKKNGIIWDRETNEWYQELNIGF